MGVRIIDRDQMLDKQAGLNLLMSLVSMCHKGTPSNSMCNAEFNTTRFRIAAFPSTVHRDTYVLKDENNVTTSTPPVVSGLDAQ